MRLTILLLVVLSGCAGVQSVPYLVSNCKYGTVCAVSARPTNNPLDGTMNYLVDCYRRGKECVVIPQPSTTPPISPTSAISTAVAVAPAGALGAF